MTAQASTEAGSSTARAAPALVGFWTPLTAQDTTAFWDENREAIASAGASREGIARVSAFDQVTEGAGAMVLYDLTNLAAAERVQTPVTAGKKATSELAWQGTISQPYTLRVAPVAVGSGDLRDAACVLSVRLFVPDEWRDQVREWLDQEHYQRHLALPGCRWYHGYESVEGPFNFLNLWGLDSPDVIEQPSWATARDTPWRERLMPAFANAGRAVYRFRER